MPAVPYKPFPQEEAKVSATPGYNLRVPTEAFGSSVGTAFEKLGGQIEHSADTFSKIVLEQKKLENDTWANNALTKGETKIGELEENYRQQEGQNAVDARPGHVQAIQDARQDVLDSAPNPEAKRMVDEKLSRRVAFSIVDAGRHSGQQAKVANNESTKSGLETSIRNLDVMSSGLPDQIQAIRDKSDAVWANKGLDDKVLKEKADRAVELAIGGGVSKLAAVDPLKAQAAWERLKDQVPSADVRNQVEPKLNNAMTSKDVTTAATALVNGEEVNGISIGNRFNPETDSGNVQSIRMAAEAVADERGKGIPGYKEHFVSTVMNRINTLEREYKQAKTQQLDALSYIIAGGGDPNNSIVDEAGILANPKAAAIWQGLNQKERNAILGQIHTANKAAEPHLGDPGVMEEVKRIQGLVAAAKAGDSRAQEAISGTFIMEAKIPPAQKNEFLKEKLKMTGKVEDDPKFSKYLSDARPLLNKLGISSSYTDQKQSDNYYKFYGEFRGAITAWEQEHGGKAPDYKERDAIVQRLVKDQVKSQKGGGGGWFGRDLTSERYKVYSEHRDEMVDDYMQSHNGQTPTEAELRRAFEKAFPAVH